MDFPTLFNFTSFACLLLKIFTPKAGFHLFYLCIWLVLRDQDLWKEIKLIFFSLIGLSQCSCCPFPSGFTTQNQLFPLGFWVSSFSRSTNKLYFTSSPWQFLFAFSKLQQYISHSEERWSLCVLPFVQELPKTLFRFCFIYCTHTSRSAGAFGSLVAAVVARTAASASLCLCTAPGCSCALLSPLRVRVWFGSSMACATLSSTGGWQKWGRGVLSKSTYCSANGCSFSPLQLSWGILLPYPQSESPVPGHRVTAHLSKVNGDNLSLA